MTPIPGSGGRWSADGLARQVRDDLRQVDPARLPITYRSLAEALGLKPPKTIHRVAEALEHLMREDATMDRPFIASLLISKARGGLPAPGFFKCARRLGRYDGAVSGPAARAFHAAELDAAITFLATTDARRAVHRTEGER